MAITYASYGALVKPMDFNVIGGKRYKTVKMPDGKIWLAENLDLRISNNDVYYKNNEATYGSNGRNYGLLYNSSSCQVIYNYLNRFIPEWRLPTESDWNSLMTSVNNDPLKLKSTEYWDNQGTDDYGFNALPSGYCDLNNNVFSKTDIFCTYINYSTKTYLFEIDGNSMLIVGWSTPVRLSIRLVRDSQ